MLEQRDPRIIPVKVQDELKTAYLSYAMSAITARALPDVRDGLKPSQRRILVAMNDLNLAPGRGFRKCAKIAGDTSGNYHPHGEAIVYPTLVHMAQNFRLRYPLVDGQGNFGSIDGYPPAAMRYTEARMSHAAVEMLSEIDRDTVDLIDNYDETRTEPEVLPARFPNLMCNGSVGISVAYATKLPPHNVTEVCDALTVLIDDPEIDIDGLMEVVKAPDFPTGGVIYGMSGVRSAYLTGSGIIKLRARTHMVTPEGRSARRLLSYHGAAFLLMLLALLSKEVALALLPLWIAFEFTLGRVGRWAAPPARRAGAVVSLAGACVAYLVLRGIALGELGTGGVPNFEPWTPQGLATVALCVFQYLGKMALPVELGFGFEVEPFRTAGALLPVLSLIGAGGLMALTIWATLRRPGVGFALWWVWLGLAPALNIVPITETAAERFAFVPSVGFCLLMGLLVQDVRRNRSGGSDRRWAAAACAAVVVLAAGHACLAASGAGHWRTQRTLYLSTLRSSPDSPVSQEFAAEAYVSDPDTPLRAALHYRRCLELAGGKPHLQLLAHAGLGRFYARQGRLSSALLHLRSALRLDEALAGVRVSLAVVMLEMAMDENLPAGWALAKGHAERVLREEDDPPGDAYVVLGCWKLEMRKDPARAAALFAEAIREDPRLILAAEAAFDEAVKKNPEDPEAHYQLALICAQQGNIEKALRAAGHALRIVPTQRAKDLIEELQSRKQAAQD